MAEQKTMPLPGVQYPKRPKFFSVRFTRLIDRAGIMHRIKAEGHWLLSVIVNMEDKLHYSKPPDFWNVQLTDRSGWSVSKLDRVRTRCIETGWLYYEPGNKARPGVYWVLIPDWVPFRDDDASEWASIPRDGFPAHQCAGNRVGNRKESEKESEKESAQPPTLTPKPSTPTNSDVAVVEKRLREDCRLAKSVETASAALSNGLGLSQIREVIDYWLSRPHAWGPGALRNRLISPSALNLPPDEGWPPPYMREREHTVLRAEREASREAADKTASRQAEKEELKQLELQFGSAIDELDFATQADLLGHEPTAVRMLRNPHFGPQSKLIRPSLLREFARRAEEN
ncbi:MAG: hypothetical protein ACYTFA_17290 [Planctomycetota bacterium]|jgi:hypothetical protein